MLTNEAGEITSHWQGMFNRAIRFLEAGIKPLYVFDGKPLDLKKQELAKRYSKRADATEELAAAVEQLVVINRLMLGKCYFVYKPLLKQKHSVLHFANQERSMQWLLKIWIL
ncbi:PREDICTED: flap endonuclease 1-A-like [Populus euphratica]|uniref:Flap endonuclease 1-A-like n=1 Tax=Populus euphratica TaxID=75702 RepID=A0AAJ6UZK4_POPEU|nr:PREDICTED: flap endonuclease 1-A-like [Populus euphratica]